MRCYKKPFSWELVDDEWLPVWGDGLYRNSPARDLPEWLYFVHVCGFQFVFTSFEQIAEYRAFYSQPLKPSFRYVDTRHGEHSSWKNDADRARFHKLPLYLWQKAKRVKVVAALERAIREFAKD